MRMKISVCAAVCMLATLAAAEVPLAGLGSGWGLDYVGSQEQSGRTWYDYQHNGSMSRMIAYGSDGSIHVAFMKGLASGAATNRHVYYNKRLATGVWQYDTTGTQVSTLLGSGYCTLDLDPSGNAVVAYHGPSPNNIVYIWNGSEYACPDQPGRQVVLHAQ